MQAILVKYLGATNFKPSRYKASCAAGSVTVSYDYSGKGEDTAALAMVEKMKWEGNLIKGQLPNGDYVYTFACSDRLVNPTVDPRQRRTAMSDAADRRAREA